MRALIGVRAQRFNRPRLVTFINRTFKCTYDMLMIGVETFQLLIPYATSTDLFQFPQTRCEIILYIGAASFEISFSKPLKLKL